MQKSQFIAETQRLANDLADIRDRASALADPAIGIWFADGFNPGGANPVTDEDLAGYGCSATDFQNVIGATGQLLNYFGNQAVATSNYLQLINKVRSQV